MGKKSNKIRKMSSLQRRRLLKSNRENRWKYVSSAATMTPAAEVQTSAETGATQQTNDVALRLPSGEPLETLVVKVELDDPSYEDPLLSSRHHAKEEPDEDTGHDDAFAPNTESAPGDALAPQPSTSATVSAPRPAKRRTELKTQSSPLKKSSRLEQRQEMLRLRAEQRALEQRKKAAALKRKKLDEKRRREAPWKVQWQLIAAVRERPLLYLRAPPLPPGQPPAAALQERQWREIAEELYKPLEWVQSEWRALCRAYHRRLLAAGGDAGAAAALPEWRFDEQMRFFRRRLLDGDMDAYVGGTRAAGSQTDPAALMDAYEATFARLRPAYARLPAHDRRQFLAQCTDYLNELVETDRIWNAEVDATTE